MSIQSNQRRRKRWKSRFIIRLWRRLKTYRKLWSSRMRRALAVTVPASFWPSRSMQLSQPQLILLWARLRVSLRPLPWPYSPRLRSRWELTIILFLHLKRWRPQMQWRNIHRHHKAQTKWEFNRRQGKSPSQNRPTKEETLVLTCALIKALPSWRIMNIVIIRQLQLVRVQDL